MGCGCKKRNVEKTVEQTPTNQVNESGYNISISGSTNTDDLNAMIEKIKKLNNG